MRQPVLAHSLAGSLLALVLAQRRPCQLFLPLFQGGILLGFSAAINLKAFEIPSSTLRWDVSIPAPSLTCHSRQSQAVTWPSLEQPLALCHRQVGQSKLLPSIHQLPSPCIGSLGAGNADCLG